MHDFNDPTSYRARTKSARRVILLDFDGVLHHEAVYVSRKLGIYLCPQRAPGAALFEWAHYLVEALSGHPDVRIVLSTSWCRKPGFDKAKARLPLELQERVIGGTFHKRIHGADPHLTQSFMNTPRGLQVLADVKRRQPVHWLALDDDAEDWPQEHLGNLLECDGAKGLSDACVRAKLQAWLEATAPEASE